MSAITPHMPNVKQSPHWGHCGVCVKYLSRVVFFCFPFLSFFSDPVELIFMQFASYDINCGLLHSQRDKNAESFHFPLFLPQKTVQKGV